MLATISPACPLTFFHGLKLLLLSRRNVVHKGFKTCTSLLATQSPQVKKVSITGKLGDKEEEKKMALKLNLIAAACENGGIGYKNDLPWRLRQVEKNAFIINRI